MIITIRYTSTNVPGVVEKTLLSRDDYDKWVVDNPECTVTSRLESNIDANIVYNTVTLNEVLKRFIDAGTSKKAVNTLVHVIKYMKGE